LQPRIWQDLLAQAAVSPLSQPWLKLSFALDLNSFAKEAIWYRFVNVILHIASCVYLYLLAFRISRRFQPVVAESNREYDALPMKIALYSSLLFAVHPLATESIAYISGRAGVLTGANCLLAINFFLLGFWSDRLFPIVFGYVGCLACILMGFGTSPEGTAIPFILLACAYLLRSSKESRRFLNERTAEIVILVMLSIALPFSAKLPFWNDFGNNFGIAPLTAASYYASELKGFLFYYLRCALVPVGMSVEPPYFVATSLDSPGTVIGALSYLALAYLVVFKRDKLLISFPLAIVVLGYLPSLLIQRGEYGADRRFYIPLAGLCLLAGWNYARLCLGRPKTFLLAGGAILIAFFGLTIWRQFDWTSTYAIWQAAERVSASEHVKAVNALIGLGVEKKADDSRKQAADLMKNDPAVQLNYLTLAAYELGKGNNAAAKPLLEKAWTLATRQRLDRFDQYKTALLYAKILNDQGQYQTALDVVMPIYFAFPDAAQPNLYLGEAMLGKNEPTTALRYLDAAYKTDKLNPEYVVPLARACFATNIPVLIENAYKSTKVLTRYVPNTAVSLCFAQAALQVGRPNECQMEMEKILRFSKPGEVSKEDLAKVYYLKGKAFKEMGQTKQGDDLIKTALETDPKVADKLKIGTIKPNQEAAAPPARTDNSGAGKMGLQH
jgi:tetratricopeptide (TPR) repeat protein